MRVQILKDYVRQHFPATPLLDYALEVEKITTSKVKKMFLIPKSGFWVNFLEKMTAKSQFDCAAKIEPGFLKDFCFCCLTNLTCTQCQ